MNLEDDDPAPRTAEELPIRDLPALRALADSLDCVLQEDLCALAGIKASTERAWAKRGEGPDYVMFGNRRLYPRESFRKFLQLRKRERSRHVAPRTTL
jgi:hypothetical protein